MFPLASDSAKTPAVSPMLSPADLARWLSISRRSLDRLRSQGRLPLPDIHVGKIVRWRFETVNRYFDSVQHAPLTGGSK